MRGANVLRPSARQSDPSPPLLLLLLYAASLGITQMRQPCQACHLLCAESPMPDNLKGAVRVVADLSRLPLFAITVTARIPQAFDLNRNGPATLPDSREPFVLRTLSTRIRKAGRARRRYPGDGRAISHPVCSVPSWSDWHAGYRPVRRAQKCSHPTLFSQTLESSSLSLTLQVSRKADTWRR